MNAQWEADRRLLKEWGNILPPDLDPYRCPICDSPALRPEQLDKRKRAAGDGWKCSNRYCPTQHGVIEPVYDDHRSHRLAWAIPNEDDE